MTALVEAPHLGQTVFVSNFRCLFERSREEQLDGVDSITRTDQPDEFPRRQTSDVSHGAASDVRDVPHI